MTGRNYDWILTLDSTTGFVAGNTVIGQNSNTYGTIANVDTALNTIKVKVDNVIQQYINAEGVLSNAAFVFGGSANTNIIPYEVPSFNVSVTTTSANITAIVRSPYIAEKNAFEQRPLVRLYTIYYPGDWYPTNANGNPKETGTGLPWPVSFPYRFAEVRGDIISDILYRVLFDAESYQVYPIDSTGIKTDSSGKIGEVTLTLANFDNLIGTIVEDPFIAGNNTTNSIVATVNSESVNGIDPRTVIGDPSFSQAIVDARGGNNLPFDFNSTEDVNGIWKLLKQDSRDLLGAVVEIKSTFANFLDVWPEYSTVRGTVSNSVEMFTTLPYRPGDIITSNSSYYTSNARIDSIKGNYLITNNSIFINSLDIGDKIYIENIEADSENFVLDTFKIDKLEVLNDQFASFSLTSWLQFFKLRLPKRRYLKNTCPWIYKGSECQYPDNGTDTIPGSCITNANGQINCTSANGFFDINNITVGTEAEDVCAKNFIACELRKNERHFGGFPATGRTIPR